MKRGLLGEFDDASLVTGAIVRLRQAGYTRLDAWSPYPVRAIEEALDLDASRLPMVALIAGLLGALGGYGLQWWLTVVDYPLDVGGRPLHSAPAFVPIAFELGILSAALATVVGLIARCGLPRLWRPVFEVEGFERAQVDRFFLGIDASDPRFDQEHGTRELQTSGALRVVGFGVALLALSLAGCDADTSFERMTRQARGQAFRDMSRPVEGTVPRGATGVSEVPVTRELLALGRERFEITCAACHGVAGDGDSVVAARMTLRKPPSLVTSEVRALAPERVYEIVTQGHGLMPGVLASATERERWAVVAYLRALVLSREVALDELPAPLAAEAREALRGGSP